ncbi:hypothetical protein Dimus_019376 [Dionaea muscipula]
MRRLGLVDEEIDGEDDGFGLEFHLPRVSFEVDRPLSRAKRSFHRRSFSLASSLSLVNLRQSFHYDRLPPVPVHLTIVKLDGSRFAIDVQKSATVAELKRAIQGAFSHMPTKGPGKISWRHVWGHFCLSYYDEILDKDGEPIKDYGIKDGDELHFVRHVPTSYNLTNKQSSKHGDIPKACWRSEILEVSEVEEDGCDHLENLNSQQSVDDDESPVVHQESVFSSFFRGWFFYSRLESAQTPGLEVEACPSRTAKRCFCCFRSMFQFYTQ